VYSTGSQIRIRSSTGNGNSWTDQSRQWVIAHELGHLLRLLDATATCDAGTSVMRTNACGVIGAGDVIDPTVSDTAAIVKAIYGSANKKTCGW